jgi:hypothetical protein
MKNVKRTIGEGFKPEKSLFGVAINNYSVYKFTNPGSKEIKVALVNERTDTVCDDERVYSFDNETEFSEWTDKIHEGDGSYLHYQDGGLVARAYPVFTSRSSDEDFDYENQEQW